MDVEYVFEKGKGWLARAKRRSSACWCCGSDSIYCCEEGSPFYDTFDYWAEKGRELAETG